ncbi:hypothetical protein ACP4OV_031659 [Aristida adscensionis]
MSTEQQDTTAVGGAGSKKHTRSRGRAKRAHPQDPFASAYGVVPYDLFFRRRPWMHTEDLGDAHVGSRVLLFGALHSARLLGNGRADLILLSGGSSSVPCVVAADVTTRMVRFAVTLPRGTPIDVEGVVFLPADSERPLPTSQQVKIQVTKLHSMGRAIPRLQDATPRKNYY